MLYALRAVSVSSYASLHDWPQPLPQLLSRDQRSCYRSLSQLQREARSAAGRGRAAVVDYHDTETGRRWRYDSRYRNHPGRGLLELWTPQAPQPRATVPEWAVTGELGQLVPCAAPVSAPGRVDRRGQVLALMRACEGSWMAPRQVAAALGCSRSAASACLRRCAEAGLLVHTGAGRASVYASV